MKKEKSENKEGVPTEMELELEHTQQGSVMDPVTHKFNFPSHSRWQSALAFDHLKSKRTIESRAKRSSKIISLGHCSILLASSHTMKMKMDILLDPISNKLLVDIELTDAFGKPFEVLNNIFKHWVFNSLVHSSRALSALRRFGLRTASTAAKPNQGDSSEFYLITGSIHTDQRGTVVLATLFNRSEQRHFRSFITNINLQESRRLQLLAKKDVNSQLYAHTSNSLSMIAKRPTTQLPQL
nr:hypothetical protein [Tanacetum cinerariifolium]